MKEKFKKILWPVYNNFIIPFKIKKGKQQLRKQLTETLVNKDYPFDFEAKFLFYSNLNLSPMFDIGANIGFYSSILEDKVGSENLYLFEPVPELNKYLKTQFRNSMVFDFALSDKTGKDIIQIPYINGELFTTRASLNKHKEIDQTGSKEIKIQKITLDDFFKQYNLNSINFIKIDVEGHEDKVITGGLTTISRFKPLLLIEIEQRHHEFEISRIFSILEEIGYCGYFFKPITSELLPISKFKPKIDQNLDRLVSRDFQNYFNNFFFVNKKDEKIFLKEATTFLEVK